MIADAINRIIQLATPEALKSGDLLFSDRTLKPVTDPAPESRGFTTLGGFVAALAFLEVPVFVQVVSPTLAQAVSKSLDRFGRRHVLLEAKSPDQPSDQFGRFQDHEAFVIWLLSQFTSDGDREYLLKLASNLTAEAVRISDDDGIGQMVTQRAGVALRGKPEVAKNRVSLAPFRSFRECDQIASEFVFRVRQAEGQVPTLALFEADGGGWKVLAMQLVASYLRNSIHSTDPDGKAGIEVIS